MVLFSTKRWVLKKYSAVGWRLPLFETASDHISTIWWFGPYCLLRWNVGRHK